MKFISRINGPVVKAKGDDDFSVQDMVYVGKIRLIGEVISVDRDEATIQVYESTSGLMPGEPVETTGQPLSVYLAPGIIGNMFDGMRNFTRQAVILLPAGNSLIIWIRRRNGILSQCFRKVQR